MIPISVARRIISGINQLKRGLLEAAEWVEEQAYEGSEDYDALAGDRYTVPAESLPVEEPATVATTLAEAAPTPDPLPKVSSVEVRIDSDLMSFAVPGSANVVGPPRATFEEAVRSFAIDVLAEASYREARTRGSAPNKFSTPVRILNLQESKFAMPVTFASRQNGNLMPVCLPLYLSQ